MPLAVRVAVNHLGDRVQLDRVYDGTDIDAFIQRVANTKRVHAGAQAFIERLGHGLMHQQA